MDELTVAGLLLRSRAVLGGARTEAALACVRASRLTRRHDPLAGLAALVVGAPLVGEDWFRGPLRHTHTDERYGVGDQLGSAPVTPDDVLLGRAPSRTGPWPDRVRSLGYLIADAVAGPAVDFADLNSPRAAEGLRMPDGAEPGSRCAMRFDPGGLVEAVVTRRPDGTLGYDLDLDTVTFSAPAEIDWAVGILWQDYVLLLPPELPGTESDPLTEAIGSDLADTAETLRTWARDHGLGQDAGPHWVTLGDADQVRWLASRALAGEPTGGGSPGAAHIWNSAMAALIDGDVENAQEEACRLRG